MKKICTACKKEKTLDRFHKEIRGKFGVKSKCSECIASVSSEWKRNNKEREQENRKRWNATNKDYHKILTYRWREDNKEQHNTYVAKYQAKRKANDPKFKLLSNMRSLLYNHLTRRDFKKHEKLEQYLQCSFDYFRNHIETQFHDLMTWENYGSLWSIDHICPCSQAQNEKELIELQCYENLRPMITHGSSGNFAKSDCKTNEAEKLCKKLLHRDWL